MWVSLGSASIFDVLLVLNLPVRYKLLFPTHRKLRYSLYYMGDITGLEDNLSETLSCISLTLNLSIVSGIWNRFK